MKFLVLLFLATAYAENLEGLLGAMPGNILSSLMDNDSKMQREEMQKDEDKTSPLKIADGFGKWSVKPLSLVPPVAVGAPIAGSGKMLKAAAVKAAAVKAAVVAVPAKTVALKAVAAKVLAVPKLKAVPVAAAFKKKPKVHSLKPIVHIIEKPVPVYHKVPVPKKVFVPKFYPVYKKIPVLKIIPVPFKVPVKKIIPKIVKIPKAILIPKFVPVKKPFPIAIPYPVPKFYKVPIPKPVPYKKYIPIPIKKKVPKFIPVPVKKIIKVPKPYYVPIKVPHFTASYIRTPMAVKVPNIKKVPYGRKLPGLKKPSMNFPKFNGDELKFLESGEGFKYSESGFDNKGDGSLLGEPLSNMGKEDKELLNMLTGSMLGDKNTKI